MSIENVKQAIGIPNFKKTELLEIALTHPSYIEENNKLNQSQKSLQKREYRRLALLGDSILGTVVIDYLYDRLPAENQGTLTNWKSDLVRRTKAYEFARKLKLRQLCWLGKGEKFRDESGQVQLFGEMFEALLGAIYLEFERDFSRARNWLVDRFIADAVNDLLADTLSEEQSLGDDVQAISLMNSDEAAEHLRQMKQKADALVAENEEFQQLLSWVNEKAISVGGSYNPAKVRAFYFALVGILGRAFFRNFDPTRSKAKDRNQARQFALSFNRAHDLALDLAFELNHNTDPGNILIPIFALDIEPRLKQVLQQLQAELPNPKEDKEKFEDWRQDKGQDWVEEIKDAIGYELQFSEQQKELLKQYYNANKLLIDCIYKAEVATEVREEILETLFLPRQHSSRHKAMSKVSQSQEEQITQHPLQAVAEQLESLLEKLRMELDVAPTDRTAHQDLLRRIIQACEKGLQIPAQKYPTSPSLPEGETQELTEEELELLNSVEWITVVEEGQEIDDEALDNWLRQRGYKV